MPENIIYAIILLMTRNWERLYVASELVASAATMVSALLFVSSAADERSRYNRHEIAEGRPGNYAINPLKQGSAAAGAEFKE